MRRFRLTQRILIEVLAGVVVLSTGALLEVQAAVAAGTPLVGTFTITAGSCSGGTASGTYLRMVLSGGTNAAGPYFSNSDSTCSDNTYTPLAPGSEGGLVTGSYEAQASPAFDSAGNALAARITAPVAFEGVKFSTATNPVDPQTGLNVPAPSIELNGTTLSGNLQSFGVSWNNQEFNQGSPKPDRSSPGNTTPVTGVYNPSSGDYTLQWSSQVVGGPFNGFSAFWNLTGRFVPASGVSAAPSGGGSNSGAATSASGAPAMGTARSTHSGTSGTLAPAFTGATGSGASSSGSTAASTGGTATAPAGATSSTRAHGVSPVTKTHTVVSVRTVTGETGWRSPNWLVLAVAGVAVFGLGGVLWAERQLRRRRKSDDLELKGV
jgi:hypothetical protein